MNWPGVSASGPVGTRLEETVAASRPLATAAAGRLEVRRPLAGGSCPRMSEGRRRADAQHEATPAAGSAASKRSPEVALAVAGAYAGQARAGPDEVLELECTGSERQVSFLSNLNPGNCCCHLVSAENRNISIGKRTVRSHKSVQVVPTVDGADNAPPPKSPPPPPPPKS